MKKNLLMGLVGLGAFAMLATGVKAETLDLENTTTTGQNVTVGDVDVPVYSVDIKWGDMTYDWKYDSDSSTFGFKAKLGCEGYIMSLGDYYLPEYKEKGYVYSDNACTQMQTSDLVEGNTYYTKTKVGGEISITDNSVNGFVRASVEFNPSENYEWVTGKFYESYVLNLDTGKIEYKNEIVDGYLPRVAGLDVVELKGFLYLDSARNGAIIDESNSNDVIGTVTVNINPM